MKITSIVPTELKILSWPIVYTKIVCPWCAEARATLDRHEIRSHERSVTGDADAFAETQRLSGQTKAPVLDRSGEIRADFGAVELETFIAALVYAGKVQL